MTILYTHPAADRHRTPNGHPEQVARLGAVLDAISDLPLDLREAPVGAWEDVLRCHPQSYVDTVVQAEPQAGSMQLDADTWMSPGSMEAARRAVGGACAAVDAVVSGEARRAFVAMRPPGHHAEAETPMGFCLFGTVAVAAKRALNVHGLSRVAVVDFDVHHGNGTQDLLWDEDRIRFANSFQSPLWPGTGGPHETGAHGQVLSRTLDPGAGGRAFRPLWEGLLADLDAFAPELVLVSAGFDAHRDDPLASLMLEDEDFGWITERLVALADAHAGGRLVSCLEGGYDLAALGRSARAHVAALGE